MAYGRDRDDGGAERAAGDGATDDGVGVDTDGDGTGDSSISRERDDPTGNDDTGTDTGSGVDTDDDGRGDSSVTRDRDSGSDDDFTDRRDDDGPRTSRGEPSYPGVGNDQPSGDSSTPDQGSDSASGGSSAGSDSGGGTDGAGVDTDGDGRGDSSVTRRVRDRVQGARDRAAEAAATTAEAVRRTGDRANQRGSQAQQTADAQDAGSGSGSGSGESSQSLPTRDDPAVQQAIQNQPLVERGVLDEDDFQVERGEDGDPTLALDESGQRALVERDVQRDPDVDTFDPNEDIQQVGEDAFVANPQVDGERASQAFAFSEEGSETLQSGGPSDTSDPGPAQSTAEARQGVSPETASAARRGAFGDGERGVATQERAPEGGDVRLLEASGVDTNRAVEGGDVRLLNAEDSGAPNISGGDVRLFAEARDTGEQQGVDFSQAAEDPVGFLQGAGPRREERFINDVTDGVLDAGQDIQRDFRQEVTPGDSVISQQDVSAGIRSEILENRDAVSTAALAGVAAPEPTSTAAGAVGLVVVGGAAAVANNEIEVPNERPDTFSEIDAPTDEPATVPSELAVPDDPVVSGSELPVATDQPVSTTDPEIGVPNPNSQADPTTIQTSPGLIERGEEQQEDPLDGALERFERASQGEFVGEERGEQPYGISRDDLRQTSGVPSSLYRPGDGGVTEPSISEEEILNPRVGRDGTGFVGGTGPFSIVGAADATSLSLQEQAQARSTQADSVTDLSVGSLSDASVPGVFSDSRSSSRTQSRPATTPAVGQPAATTPVQSPQQAPRLVDVPAQATPEQFDEPSQFTDSFRLDQPTTPRVSNPTTPIQATPPGFGTPSIQSPPRQPPRRPPQPDFETSSNDSQDPFSLGVVNFSNPVADPASVLGASAQQSVDAEDFEDQFALNGGSSSGVGTPSGSGGNFQSPFLF